MSLENIKIFSYYLCYIIHIFFSGVERNVTHEMKKKINVVANMNDLDWHSRYSNMYKFFYKSTIRCVCVRTQTKSIRGYYLKF